MSNPKTQNGLDVLIRHGNANLDGELDVPVDAAEARIEIVPGAGHLFDEQGALAAVAAAVVLVRSPFEGASPLSRVSVNDVHSQAFEPGGAAAVLFGHHDGVLGSTEGGRTWRWPAGYDGRSRYLKANYSLPLQRSTGHL